MRNCSKSIESICILCPKAIETPGGNDDRQWLTFWLIFALWLFFEKYFARIVLSTVPLYYECKLALLIWLVWKNGAELCYRRLRMIPRRIFSRNNFVLSDQEVAQQTLDIMKKTGGKVVERQLKRQLEKSRSKKANAEWKPDKYWEYDTPETGESVFYDVRECLFELCKYLLSAKGAQELEDAKSISGTDETLLIERAAQTLSFQPRYVQIHLLGSIDEPKGRMPVMDRNGTADPYVKCHLIPSDGIPYPRQGVKSRTLYRNRSPQWNQSLEIPLMGGVLDSDGFFRSVDVKSTHLRLRFLDADVGLWSWFYYLFRALAFAGVIFLVAAYIEGATDNATDETKQKAIGLAVVLFVGYAIGYIKAVYHRSDDEVIGHCIVPLGILLDQLEHTLLLTLHPEENSETHVKPNEEGGYGVIRVKLDLTEN